MSAEITVYGYSNNNPGVRPRRPLCQILAVSEYGDISSVTFTPDEAKALARAIETMAAAAKAGRSRKPISIPMTEDRP
jgi:hypothetical protein